jgi:hypothetical protein
VRARERRGRRIAVDSFRRCQKLTLASVDTTDSEVSTESMGPLLPGEAAIELRSKAAPPPHSRPSAAGCVRAGWWPVHVRLSAHENAPEEVAGALVDPEFRHHSMRTITR